MKSTCRNTVTDPFRAQRSTVDRLFRIQTLVVTTDKGGGRCGESAGEGGGMYFELYLGTILLYSSRGGRPGGPPSPAKRPPAEADPFILYSAYRG